MPQPIGPLGPEANQPDFADIPHSSGEWRVSMEADLTGADLEVMRQQAYSPEYFEAAARVAYEGTAAPAEQDKLGELLDARHPFTDTPDRPSTSNTPDEPLVEFIGIAERWSGQKGERYWETQLDPMHKNNIPERLRVLLTSDPRRLGEVLKWKQDLESEAKETTKAEAIATAKATVESVRTEGHKHAASHDLAPSEADRPRRHRQPIKMLSRAPGFLGRSTRPAGKFSGNSRFRNETADFMAAQQAREDLERGVFRNTPEFPEVVTEALYNAATPEDQRHLATNEHYHTRGAQEQAKQARLQLEGFNAILEAAPDIADRLAELEHNMRIESSRDGSVVQMSIEADTALTRLHEHNYAGSPADHKVFVVLSDAETRMRQLRSLLESVPLDSEFYEVLFDRYVDVTEVYNRTKNVKDEHRIGRARNNGGRFDGRSTVHYHPDKGIQEDASGVITYPNGSFAIATSAVTARDHTYADGSPWHAPTPLLPVDHKIPKGLPHVVELRYHRALDAYNADYHQDPEAQARAQAYAAAYSAMVLEKADALPKGDLAADRDAGNIAAYHALYLAKQPGETPDNVIILPLGDVVVNDATYYGEHGVWHVQSNGTMSKLRRSTAGAVITEKTYDPFGKII